MPTYFQRPENALKRANEFIDVGKKEPALEVLCDVIKSKRHRTWQKIHEPIMEKYLGLCVELRKSHVAKEGLYQYKIISQQVNVRSLEDVVRKYLSLAEEKTEAARKESEQSVEDIDDLDNVNTPEGLLLSAVSGEDVQARTDRVVLIPWIKFLWESYRQCLDLLRNNNRLESLYQDVAQNAFRFCQKYQRKTEFRKLCDNLRNHLVLIQKHKGQPQSINLDSPESQQMHLDTRLFQLDTAITMELWQEAYKAVEDIHNLMELSKKTPKAQLLATYYIKLGLVFWKSGNALFHACALHRLLQLSREHRKNLSAEEMQKMSSRVLLATLSVPICPARNDIGDMLDMGNTAADNQKKLAKMLGLPSPPTRQQLIKDLIKYNVVPYVLPELKDLFNWMESEFHPLQLCTRISKVLDYLGSMDVDLNQYVPALQSNTIMRLLKQVSQIYDTILFSKMVKLVPFADHFQLEKIIVEAARNGAVQVRLDHADQMLVFGGELSVSQSGDHHDESAPQLQELPSDQIRGQLTEMSKALHHALLLIRPTQLLEERKNQKQVIIQNYRRSAGKDHQRIMQRKHIIEDRKERLENLTVQRERQEQDQIEEQQRVQRQAEQQRLNREAEDRARRKREEELQEIQRKHAKERIKTLKQSSVAPKMFSKYTEEELEKLDADEIMAKHVEQLEAEKKELQSRLKSQEKKIDFFCRAKRVEEIPLLLGEYEKDRIKDRELWEEMEDQRIQQMKVEREQALKVRDQLSRMQSDKDEFLNMLKQTRMSIYKEKLAKYEDLIKDARAKRLNERKVKRKEERRQKWYKEKEEEEQRKKDEEAKREREEQRKKEEEEYQARMAKLREQEEKQAAKLREIEERMERERQKPPPEQERDEGPGWRKEPERDGPGWRKEPERDGPGWRKEPERDGPGWRKEPERDGPGWRKEPERDGPRSWRDQPPRDDGREPEPRRSKFEERSAGAWRPREGAWRSRQQQQEMRRDDEQGRPGGEYQEREPPREEDKQPEKTTDDMPPRENAWQRRAEQSKVEEQRDGPPPRGEDQPPRGEGPPPAWGQGPPQRVEDESDGPRPQMSKELADRIGVPKDVRKDEEFLREHEMRKNEREQMRREEESRYGGGKGGDFYRRDNYRDVRRDDRDLPRDDRDLRRDDRDIRRDDRDMPRDDRDMRREDRDMREDGYGGRGGIRRGGDRRDDDGGSWRSAPRDDRRWDRGGRDDRGGRGGGRDYGRDDRSGGRDDGRSWRGGGGGEDRDSDRPPRRIQRDTPPRRDDGGRGPPARGEGGRDDWRREGGRDRGSDWRRGGDRDRGFDRGGDRDRGYERGRGERDRGFDRERGGGGRDDWRRGDKEAPPQREVKKPPQGEEDDDGWTTVARH